MGHKEKFYKGIDFEKAEKQGIRYNFGFIKIDMNVKGVIELEVKKRNWWLKLKEDDEN